MKQYEESYAFVHSFDSYYQVVWKEDKKICIHGNFVDKHVAALCVQILCSDSTIRYTKYGGLKFLLNALKKMNESEFELTWLW